ATLTRSTGSIRGSPAAGDVMRLWPRLSRAVHSSPESASTDQGPLPNPQPGWPSVPPIQRVVPQLTPTVQRHFEASLGSHQDPRFLAPLAHLAAPDGPGGRIGGLVPAAAPPGQQAPDRAAGEVRRWPLGVPVVSRASDAESGEPVASSPLVGSDAADAEPQ